MAITTPCPRCSEPVLTSFDKGNRRTQFCYNCGLEYIRDEIPKSFGIIFKTFQDGHFEYQIITNEPKKTHYKDLKSHLNVPSLLANKSYIHVFNRYTFSIDAV